MIAGLLEVGDQVVVDVGKRGLPDSIYQFTVEAVTPSRALAAGGWFGRRSGWEVGPPRRFQERARRHICFVSEVSA